MPSCLLKSHNNLSITVRVAWEVGGTFVSSAATRALARLTRCSPPRFEKELAGLCSNTTGSPHTRLIHLWAETAEAPILGSVYLGF